MSETVLKEILDELKNLKSQMNNRFDTIEMKMVFSEQKITAEITQIKQAVMETNQDVK